MNGNLSPHFCDRCGRHLSDTGFCEACDQSKELSSPLAAIVIRAMRSKPDGKLSQVRQKIEQRMKNASDIKIALVDVSASMGESIGCLKMTKHDHLCIALRSVRRYYPDLQVIAFNGTVQSLAQDEDPPPPCGGTDMARALEMAARLRPQKTVIISDGLPDNESDARQEAAAITGTVDTIYCGPDGHPAIEFLRSLAHDTGGISVVWHGMQDTLGRQIVGLIG